MEKVPPNSWQNKKILEWGVILSYTPHSYTILPRWKPTAAQKDVRALPLTKIAM